MYKCIYITIYINMYIYIHFCELMYIIHIIISYNLIYIHFILFFQTFMPCVQSYPHFQIISCLHLRTPSADKLRLRPGGVWASQTLSRVWDKLWLEARTWTCSSWKRETTFTLWKINMEPTNHPFRKEHDLNQTSIIMFHVHRGVHEY